MLITAQKDNIIHPIEALKQMKPGEISIKNKTLRHTEINIEGWIGMVEKEHPEGSASPVSTYEKFKHELEQINTPEIIINIRSLGGNLQHALLIHDTLQSLSKKITTRCYGYVASAATIIAQAASKGGREISANGLYLVHQSISAGEGNIHQISATVDLLEQTDRRIAALYAERSGKSVELFNQLMQCNAGQGKWLTAQEAKEAGLIDRIIPQTQISNEVQSALKVLGLPEIPPSGYKNRQQFSKLWRALLELINSVGHCVLPDPLSTPPRTKSNPKGLPHPEHKASQEEVKWKKIDLLARAQALPTRTFPIEDPAATEERASANERAYQEDLSKLIN